MQTENWKTVKDILFEVLRLEPARQIEYLEKTEMTREIREEILSLLACSAESESFMSLSLEEFWGDSVNCMADEISLIGQKLGNYEIIEEIGFGGMGAVYLAERCDGKFEQKAAIKMLKREFNCAKFREYFRREREIQAKLNHPNVARLLDAGTTNEGVPFLVMEFIEGLPVDKFCKSKSLSLKARLKIFSRVCDAVMHAHRNLTVHRDLKPSNIIVNEENEPKLLDFGISKLLDAKNAESESIQTIFAAMTPEYASPEQIKGEPVTTATDIYSLGVVLYKILTDSLPFELKEKSNDEIFRIITKTEPLAPSTVINPPFQIPNSSLKGDIDNIILKALRKEPELRYQTVEQFSADIWRFVDGLPVEARPATVSYRANKYFQRNKFAVVSAALILLSLVGGIAVALWQAKEANAQTNFALNAQKQSEKEREKAEKISDFMTKIISFSSPHWSAEGAKYKGETKVIEAMMELGGQIDAEFADQLDVQIDLHHKFASAYNFHVGDEFRKKERFHTMRSFELHKQLYGEYHELVAKEMFSLWNSLPVDDPKQAEILMEAINMMRGTNPNNLNLAYMYEAYANRLASASKTMQQPQFIEENVKILSVQEVNEMYRKAVSPSTGKDNYQIAEDMWRESLPIFRLHYGENHLAVYNAECRLSYILAVQRKWIDLSDHYTFCKQGVDQMQNQEGKNQYKYLTKPVEEILNKKDY